MNRAPAKKETPRRGKLRWLMVGLAVVCACIVAPMIFLQTPPARRYIESEIAASISAVTGGDVRVEGLTGLVPLDMQLGAISFSDKDGAWMEIRGVRVTLSATALLRTRLVVQRLAAENIDVRRAPASEVQTDAAWGLAELPPLPKAVSINDIEIQRIEIAESLARTTVTLRASGSYRPDAVVPIHVDVNGVESTKLTASLAGGWSGDAVSLSLSASDETLAPAISGAEGPLAFDAKLVGPIRKAALTAKASIADTPLFDVSGTCSIVSPTAVALNGMLRLPENLVPSEVYQVASGALAVGIDVTLEPDGQAHIKRFDLANDANGIKAAGNLDLNSMRADLSFEARCADLNQFATVRTGSATPLLLRGTAQGTTVQLDLDARAEIAEHEWLQANAAIHADDGVSAQGSLKVLPAPAALPPSLEALVGKGADANFDLSVKGGALNVATLDARIAAATVSARGTLDWAASKADLTLEAKAADLAAFSGVAGATLAGNATASFRMESDGTATTIHADAQGAGIAADELRMPEARLAAALSGGAMKDLFKSPLSVTLTGAFPGIELQRGAARDLKVDTAFTVEDLQRVEITHLDASDGNLKATASGRVDLASRQGDLSASLHAADFGAYAKPLGYPYGGELALEARVASATKAGTLELSLKGHADKLSGLPRDMARLGSAATFNAHGEYDGAAVHVDTLHAAAGGVALSGDGSYGINDRAMTASLKGDAKDLAAFDALAGRKLAGSASISAVLSGTLDQFSLKGSAVSNSLRVDVVHAPRATAEFAIEGLPTGPRGTARAMLESKGDPMEATVDFAKNGGVLQVPGLEAHAGANVIRAQGQWDIAKASGSGTLDADLPNLKALRAWVDVPMDGAATLNAQLAHGAAALNGSLSATGLVLPGFSVGSAKGDANLQQPFHAPSGKLALTATSLKAGDFAIDTLTLNADGPADALDIALESEGAYQGAIPFSLKATGKADCTSRRLNLQALAATINTHDVTLDAPASLSAGKVGVILTPARLRLGGGQLKVEGTFDDAHAHGHAEWSAVPLALADLLGGAPLQGTTSGSAELSGTAADPVLGAEIAVSRFHISDDDADRGLPGIDAIFLVALKDGHATSELEANAGDAIQAQGKLDMPVSWTLSPWHFTVPRQAALVGTFTAKGDLSAVPDLLGIEGHVLRGELDASVLIGGNVAAPTITGEADLSNGYYENKTSGTILDALSAHAEASGTKFRLTKLTATDTAAGTLRATGELALNASRPFSVDASLTDMRLVRRDDVTAAVSGTIKLAGNDSGANVTGDLQIGPATVVLPERLPEQQITTVKFRVAGEEAPDADAEADRQLFDYPIALNVHCAIPGGATVRARGLKSEWEGDLKITGTAQAPALKGVLRVRSGKLVFLGRDFDLRESTITFNGGTPPTPMLNILAVSQQRNVTARVRLEGELENLNVTLETDPPSSRDDALSQVLFGRNAAEISPLQGLQLARYAALFNQRVSGTGLLGGGASASMLDRLSLDSGNGLNDSTVKAGKNINDDLYLEFEQGIGSKSSAVSLEWLFAPNWSLRGKTGANSEGGAGIFWKKDY